MVLFFVVFLKRFFFLLSGLLCGAPQHDVDASSNWWGTTDLLAINQSIYDFKRDFNLGVVTFTPILESPNPAAPTSIFNITASARDGGSISSAETVSVCYGNSRTFNVTANTGYHIVDVTVNGSSVGAVSSYTFSNVNADYSITATFVVTTTPTPTPTPTATPTSTATPTTQSSTNPTQTPTTTPTPSTTTSPTPAIPEFPTIILLPLLVLGVMFVLVFARKATKANYPPSFII
jgi:hypothetical protein